MAPSTPLPPLLDPRLLIGNTPADIVTVEVGHPPTNLLIHGKLLISQWPKSDEYKVNGIISLRGHQLEKLLPFFGWLYSGALQIFEPQNISSSSPYSLDSLIDMWMFGHSRGIPKFQNCVARTIQSTIQRVACLDEVEAGADYVLTYDAIDYVSDELHSSSSVRPLYSLVMDVALIISPVVVARSGIRRSRVVEIQREIKDRKKDVQKKSTNKVDFRSYLLGGSYEL